MSYPNTKEMNDSKWKLLHIVNICNENIDNEINDSCLAIPITNKINIEHYDLWSNFVIQPHNVSYQKSQILKDENFTKFSLLWWWKNLNIIIFLNNQMKKILIFDDIMHRK
jgi:hypothetical protein